MTPVLPTTRAGAETAVLIAFVGWRIAVLAQLLPALPTGLALSPWPTGYLAAALVVVVETIAVCGYGIRRHQAIGAVWTWCEVLGACALMLAAPLIVPAEHRIGSWIGFGPGVALAVVCLAGAGLTRSAPRGWWQLLLAAALASGCYLVSTAPAAPDTLTSTVAGNALTYPTFAVVSGLVATYVRRLARDADSARSAAAESAELAERRRNQLLLHDSASILHLVAVEETTPDLAVVLRRQAASESARIRSFLQDKPHAAAGSRSTLAQVVHEAADDFDDLPVTLVLDLGGSTPLLPACADAVLGAVRALLHNIRMHAHARDVVIHSDTDPEAGLWELSIRDDGRGYDMTGTPPGFGLSVQVHHALAEFGVATEIQSEPGEGTVAVLRGCVQS